MPIQKTDQTAAVEAALAAFSPDFTDVTTAIRELLRAVRQYQQSLAEQTPDNNKIHLLNLKRINLEAYNRVLAVLPEKQRTELLAFESSLSGGTLPSLSKPVSIGSLKPKIINP